MRLLGGAPKGLAAVVLALTAAWVSMTPNPGRAESPDSAAFRPTAKVTGFAQFDYRRAEKPDTATSSRHEFNVRRARLGIKGSVIPSIRYQLIFQGDGGAVNSASVLDMILDVRLTPVLNLRMGQFKYDFDIEARQADMTTPMTDRAFITNAVAGSLDGRSTASTQLSNARDRGMALQASRTLGAWEWRPSVGIFQGTGRANDNNDQVSVTGQLAVEGGPGLLLSGGYLYTDNEPAGGSGIDRFVGWTLGGRYEVRRVFASGEYYRASRDLGVAEEDVEGFYLIGGFDPVPRFHLRARYQTMEDEHFGSGGDEASSVDLGARWFLERESGGSGASIAVNAMFRDADSGFQGLTLLNDGRGAALDDGSKAKTVVIVRMQFEF